MFPAKKSDGWIFEKMRKSDIENVGRFLDPTQAFKILIVTEFLHFQDKFYKLDTVHAHKNTRGLCRY